MMIVGDTMKKYYKMFGIALIMAFSFYYTEQISLIVLNKSPLMITINEEKEKLANYKNMLESVIDRLSNLDK